MEIREVETFENVAEWTEYIFLISVYNNSHEIGLATD